jgi:D-arabinose 1-dehydrogenase-like Zn-dependent alcohol dehydrogenase
MLHNLLHSYVKRKINLARSSKPQVEVFPMSEVNTALERLGRNAVRYRAVLANV